jgi:hypothetical protein
VALILLSACAQSHSPTTQAPTAKTPDGLSITGPYTHDNLSIYLLHGPDRSSAKYLTLQEALEQKKVVVHETGNVNELAVENVGDDDVYIQAGEIVKGGRQDRTLGTDVIITRSMGKVPITSYCVEHGRWSQRGGEASNLFGSSGRYVAGKEMKLVSNSNYDGNSQQEVWANVAKAQDRLAENVGGQVKSADSPSSLQLTLESPVLKARTDDYEKPMAELLERPENRDAVGWAYAVNGQVSGANVYANRTLFRKLWPKLLNSGAVEALAERKPEQATNASPTTQPTASAVLDFLASPPRAAAKTKDVNARTGVSTCESSDSVLIETEDRSGSNEKWVHRSYLRK